MWRVWQKFYQNNANLYSLEKLGHKIVKILNASSGTEYSFMKYKAKYVGIIPDRTGFLPFWN